MFQVDAPWESYDALVRHAIVYGDTSNGVAIAHQRGAALESVARRPAPQGVSLGVDEQVVTPGHADQGLKAAQRDQEGGALDRASLDQVGLEPADKALEVNQQAEAIAPLRGHFSTCPGDAFDLWRQGAVFQGVPASFQLKVINLVLCLCELGEEAVVVGGIVACKV